MTPPRHADPHASARAALERLWALGQRLAAARRDLKGTLPIHLPITPEDPSGPETGPAGSSSLSLSDLD